MAVRLGRANVDAMLRSLTAKQFAEWEYYARLEPFNELRQDYRIANLVQMIANVNRGKDQKAFTLQECLLNFDAEEQPVRRRQTSLEQLEIARMFVASYSAKSI